MACTFGVNDPDVETILLVIKRLEAGDAQRRPAKLKCCFDLRHGVPKEEMMERRRSWPARIAGWCRRDAMREGLDGGTDLEIKLAGC